MSGMCLGFQLSVVIFFGSWMFCSGLDVSYVEVNRTAGMQSTLNTTVRSKTECLRRCTLDKECDVVAFKYKFENSVQCINLKYDSCAMTEISSYEVFQKEGSTTKQETGKNCKELLDLGYTEDGIYRIYLPGIDECLSVYCDMTTDGGGWLVFQRRTDGSEDFNRNWNEYKYGFGNMLNEFWLGNEYIHQLTLPCTTLHVRCESNTGTVRPGDYSRFSIASETDNYRLSISGFSGTSDEISVSYHDGMEFSTRDQDNDEDTSFCANEYNGGWWYKSCHHSLLNGVHGGTMKSYGLGPSLRKSEMKIRPCT